jgi:hypothetical protein
MPARYNASGLVLSSGRANNADTVRALQRDLRALGYLLKGIDGEFGDGTSRAVRALQYDLLNNTGASSGVDGSAPVAVTSFNDNGSGGRKVTSIDGIVDQTLAGCIEAMAADARVPKLPSTDDAVKANQTALAAIQASVSTTAPTPFIMAIVKRESDGRHFNVPHGNDADAFVTVGQDHNDQSHPDCITSRGYGIGQYTLFHHPPQPNELTDIIADPVRNVQKTYTKLRDKFDRFVCGPADTADDRKAEHPLLPLRLCKYQPGDQRYMRDCRNCALVARKINIVRGTPAYSGASISYQPTQYYRSAIYSNVPDRGDFLCDWPYALRRYNGSGVNSFHYQTIVLLNLLTEPDSARS